MLIFQATAGCSIVVLIPHNLQKIKTVQKHGSNPQAYTAIYSLLGIVQGMGFSYLSAVLSTIEKQFGIRSKVWGICKILMRMCFVSGNCLGVFWQRDQSNLFHLRSPLPQQDSQKDPLDLGGDDVRCARSLSLREPLLCKGDKTPMCNRTKDVLEANLQ